MPKHYLVFGATGPSGISFCKAALKQNHTLTLYARTPSKVPTDISENPQVTVVEGAFDDKEGLEKAAKCGADTFVSFAGPVSNNKGTKLRADVCSVPACIRLLQNPLPLLIENNIRRVLVLASPSHSDPQDQGALKWKASVMLIKVIGGTAYQEMVGIGAETTEQPVDKLAWTIFRVGFLTNGPAGPVDATYTGSGKDGMTISRDSIAEWVLQEAEEEKWVGKAPYICGK